jgi:hypothetical protein
VQKWAFAVERAAGAVEPDRLSAVRRQPFLAAGQRYAVALREETHELAAARLPSGCHTGGSICRTERFAAAPPEPENLSEPCDMGVQVPMTLGIQDVVPALFAGLATLLVFKGLAGACDFRAPKNPGQPRIWLAMVETRMQSIRAKQRGP